MVEMVARVCKKFLRKLIQDSVKNYSKIEKLSGHLERNETIKEFDHFIKIKIVDFLNLVLGKS